MNKKPRITVLIPVYNGEKYLKEAIESILNQSFTDFEFLIINDGSTDSSEKIIKSYNDSRIKLVKNEMNLGIIKTLNKGIDLAKGEYIARMDADDISLPKRLEIQINFMENHPEIGISGTWAKVMGKGNKKYIKTYSNFEKIKAITLFKNPMIHPSVIIRKDTFNKHNLEYNKDHQHAEDYGLWANAIQYFPITNIKKMLLLYRNHKKNASKIFFDTVIQQSITIKNNQLKKNLGVIPNEEEKIIHCSTYKPEQYSTLDFLDKEKKWLLKLIEQNKEIKYCKEPQFSMVMANRWLTICSINANYDFKIFRRFWKSNLRKKLDWTEIENWKILTRFFFKCLFIKSK